MKKVFSFALASMALMTASSFAQTTMNPVFEKAVGGTSPNDAPAFFANDNFCRSAALNTASTEAGGLSVIIPSRTGSNSIYVVSAADGSEIRTLDTTGVSGGTFVINAAACDSDGAVYVCNLVTSSGTGTVKVYRWATDAGAVPPTQIADGAFTNTNRAGDTMNVTKDGNNITVYVVGNNAASRVVAITSTDNGANWSTAEVGPTRAALGVAGDTPGGSIFLKSPLGDVVEYDQGGSVLNTFDAGTIGYANGSTSALDYLNDGGTEYLAIASYSSGTAFQSDVIDITNRGSVTHAFRTAAPGLLAPGNANANGTAGAGIARVGGDINVFSLASNNIYGLYSATAPSEVSDWMTFE